MALSASVDTPEQGTILYHLSQIPKDATPDKDITP
jgi:hypothetical protein